METFFIPVSYNVWGLLAVNADSLEAAVKATCQTVDNLNLPAVDEMVFNGGVAVNTDMDLIKRCNTPETKEEYETKKKIIGVRWTIEDLQNALVKEGYEDSQENVNLIMNSGIEEELEEQSISLGWEVISSKIAETDGLKKIKRSGRRKITMKKEFQGSINETIATEAASTENICLTTRK